MIYIYTYCINNYKHRIYFVIVGHFNFYKIGYYYID